MKFKIHQTHHTICDFDQIYKYIEDNAQAKKGEIHLFPENFLTGYPLADLCLSKSFIKSYEKLLSKVEKFTKNLPKGAHLLMGGLNYEYTDSDIPSKIKNVIYHISKDGMRDIYTKQLLPNYDIFDEKKYYSAGNEKAILEIEGLKLGLLICEDMWTSNVHDIDPVGKFKAGEIDIMINLSASPYNLGKFNKRVSRAKSISNKLQAPFVYVNRVGGEDEILFDGRSFIQESDETFYTANLFSEDTFEYELKSDYKYSTPVDDKEENTWESLFNARVDKDHKIKELNDDDCFELLEALKFGFNEYARKSYFNNFTIALSGGIDSALVLALIRLGLKEGHYLEAVYMPSIYSSPLSYDLSSELCKNLGIPLYNLPIKFLHSTAKNAMGGTFSMPFEGIADENIQSRLRGTLLYARSNQINSMVVNTSNKSELTVGYSTQYGDSVGAISLLGDLYKTEVYALCRYINKNHGNIIPKGIIDRPPTAELREGQVDSASLPEYETLDSIAEYLLSNRYTKEDILNFGFNREEIDLVFNLYKKTEYKRSQFCPIIKVSAKSFGFGYRIPIAKQSSYLFAEGDK
ncbi:MAG: NAD(+) synthase [Bacteriovoracaceae bacterium]|nr:NAD(+) synthase [Bacteriovoracaceae bacterium]